MRPSWQLCQPKNLFSLNACPAATPRYPAAAALPRATGARVRHEVRWAHGVATGAHRVMVGDTDRICAAAPAFAKLGIRGIVVRRAGE